MSNYFILSLDGGGIRGVITSILLERLEQAQPGLLDQVHLFAGTSTGGLLALALASGMTPRQTLQLYEEFGPVVFSDTIWDDIRDLGSLIGADYSIEPLKEALTDQFGDQLLDHLQKKVLVSAFDLDNRAEDPEKRKWKAKFFHNFPGPDSDGAESIVDVAIRSSAAPTYFPIYQGYIDGGVVANNPSVCGLAQALNPEFGDQEVKNIVLLSVGTGTVPRYLTSLDGDWGLVEWAPYMVDLVLEGAVGLADYQCKQILGGNYFRVNVRLPEPIGMDRVDRIPTMKRIARQYDLTEAVQWIDRHFNDWYA